MALEALTFFEMDWEVCFPTFESSNGLFVLYVRA